MENSKLCPNCGKPVPAGKAYCMSCGVSLGVKCPECGVVSPLGSKICTGCGHSFEVRTPGRKKKKKKNPLKSAFVFTEKYSGIIFPILVATLTVLTVVFFFLGTVKLSAPIERDGEVIQNGICATDFLENFFGGENYGVERLKTVTDRLAGDSAGINVLGDIVAVSYLAGLVFAVILLLFSLGNIGKYTKPTAKRLLRYVGIISGFSVIQFIGCLIIKNSILLLAGKAHVSELYALGGTSMAFMIVSLAFSVLLSAFILFVFAKRPEEGDEKTFGALVFKNRLIKAIGRFFGRKFRKNGVETEGWLTVTNKFPWYVGLLVASLIFTQALDNVASYVLFLFLFAAPFVLLIYTLIAKAALTVSMLSDASTIQKNQLYTYEFKIRNGSILAYPFIDAVICLPQANSVRCTERMVRLSMSPLSEYDFKNTVQFRFRGTYEIGVKCFYVYDFFRIFKVRVDIENTTDIYVLPRRLNLDDSRSIAVADSTKRMVKSPITYDKLEVSDVREYRLGDPLKSIHWNLSSKSEDFIVREYNTGTSNMTFVYCDMSARFPDEPPSYVSPRDTETTEKPKKQKKIKINRKNKNAANPDPKKGVRDETVVVGDVDVNQLTDREYYEDMNEYLADGVVELTVSAVLAELRAGRPVTLLWFDRRSEAGVYCQTMYHADDFEMIYKQFATAPLCSSEKSVGQLSALAGETDNSRQIFITGFVDGTTVAELCAVTGVAESSGYGSAEVLLYNPKERYAHPIQRELYIGGCRAQLATSGLVLRVESLTGFGETPNGGDM